MNILFVSSGNSKNGISPLTKNQGLSLEKLGHQVTYFTIKGKGIKGYIKAIFSLRNFYSEKEFNVVHAHYSLSGMVAALAGTQPLVVSLMGSDVKASKLLTYVIRFFNQLFWKKVIVKSHDMKADVITLQPEVIPNGVNFKKFRPIDQQISLQKTGWDCSKKHILFAANPARYEKNFTLAKAAFEGLSSTVLQLQTLVDVPNADMPYYLNAAEVVVLTSLWEGSPNVIKEAMACNCKIVSVNVGDITQVIGKTSGCFVTEHNQKEITEALQKALNLPLKTKGQLAITYLDEDKIAEKLIAIYKSIL